MCRLLHCSRLKELLHEKLLQFVVVDGIELDKILFEDRRDVEARYSGRTENGWQFCITIIENLRRDDRECHDGSSYIVSSSTNERV